MPVPRRKGTRAGPDTAVAVRPGTGRAPATGTTPTARRVPMAAHDGVIARSSDHLRDLWSRDLPAFGLWSTLADPVVAELLAATSFDYVCVDLQHGAASYADLPG